MMKFLKITFSIIVLLSFVACKKTAVKDNSCVDEALKEASKNIFCTQDCPGIIGCDDKTYCNECEASRFGIRKK